MEELSKKKTPKIDDSVEEEIKTIFSKAEEWIGIKMAEGDWRPFVFNYDSNPIPINRILFSPQYDENQQMAVKAKVELYLVSSSWFIW